MAEIFKLIGITSASSILIIIIVGFVGRNWIMSIFAKDLEKWKLKLQKEFETHNNNLRKDNLKIAHEYSKEIENLKSELNKDKRYSETYIKKEFLIRIFSYHEMVLDFLRKDIIYSLNFVVEYKMENLNLIIKEWKSLRLFYDENIWAINSRMTEVLNEIYGTMIQFNQMIVELIKISEKVKNYSDKEIYDMYLNCARFKKDYKDKILPLLETFKRFIHETTLN